MSHLGRSLAIAACLFCHPICVAEDLKLRPGPVDTPTEVAIGLYVIDVIDILQVTQSMEIDFVLHVSWHDPRLAVEGGESRVFGMTDVWFPAPIVANERRLLTRKMPEFIAADPEGNMLYRQRFVGEVSAPVDLRDFPLDRQKFGIRIVLPFPKDQIRLVSNEARTGRAARLTVPGWEIDEGAVVRDYYFYPADARNLPMYTFGFEARRLTGYYVWKVLLPLLLIVCMSWTAFWMDREQFAPRLGVATTSMLTLIAYWFVLGNLLPRLPYLTRLDHFLIGSTMLVFLALVQTVSMSYWQRTGRKSRARVLDQTARILFPCIYLAVVLTAFVL